MRCLLFLALLLAGCVDSGAGAPATAASQAIADGPPSVTPPDGLVIAAFEEVAGVNHLRADLRPQEGYGYGRSSGGWSGPVRNVLFYDVAGREGRWLFPDSRRAVLDQRTVGDSARVRAFVYRVAEADTDDDGAIDGDDRQSLMLSDPTGRRVVRVAEGVRRIRRIDRVADDRVLLLYDGDAGLGGVEATLDTLRVVGRASIPPVPPAD